MAEGSRAVAVGRGQCGNGSRRAAEEPSRICVMKFDTRSETEVERAPILRDLPTEGRGRDCRPPRPCFKLLVEC